MKTGRGREPKPSACNASRRGQVRGGAAGGIVHAAQDETFERIESTHRVAVGSRKRVRRARLAGPRTCSMTAWRTWTPSSTATPASPRRYPIVLGPHCPWPPQSTTNRGHCHSSRWRGSSEVMGVRACRWHRARCGVQWPASRQLLCPAEQHPADQELCPRPAHLAWASPGRRILLD